jgi:hypothetical protein
MAKLDIATTKGIRRVTSRKLIHFDCSADWFNGLVVQICFGLRIASNAMQCQRQRNRSAQVWPRVIIIITEYWLKKYWGNKINVELKFWMALALHCCYVVHYYVYACLQVYVYGERRASQGSHDMFFDMFIISSIKRTDEIIVDV